MAVQEVINAFKRVLGDRRITEKEVLEVFESAGNISQDEQKAIEAEAQKNASTFETAATTLFTKLNRNLVFARANKNLINRRVDDRRDSLLAETRTMLKAGVATNSFGGSRLSEPVKAYMLKALADNVTFFDILRIKDPYLDTEHGEPEISLAGEFNPYAQEQSAVDSLAFSHTEITPQKLKEDMESLQSFNIATGEKNKVMQFRRVTQKGTGGVTSNYDEAHWPDTMARSAQGDRWASNFCIMSDGSVHALPASRRSTDAPGRILTNGSLGRGKLMVFNGHITIDRGVVTYVGMSGRLGKLQDDGAKFVDPIAILKAHGFQMVPGLTVTRE